MKLLLLKTLLQRRNQDEGFTLPMVIAIGLIMLLLGAVNITIANEENITAISQNSRSDALAIAEVGIARYRELLDRNRLLTINDHSQWGTLAEVCDDDIASLLPSGTPPEPEWQTLVDSQDLDNDGNTTEDLGSYALVSYDYNLTNGSDNFDQTDDTNNVVTVSGNIISATGTLTVRGTAANDSGEAQIKVDIPIRINLDDMTNLAPALWIGDNTVSAADLGNNLTIGNGNVVIRDRAVRTGTTRDGCRDFSDADTTDGSQVLASAVTFSTPPVTTPPTPQGTVISDSRDLPPISEVVANVTAARAAYSVTAGALNTPLTNTPNSGQWLFGATGHNAYNPNTGSTDCPNIKLCRYYYDPPGTGGLTLTLRDTDLLTDGVARTTVLLNQPLTINAENQDVKVGSTSDIVNDSNAFEIYVRGTNNITINADAGRTVTMNSFIHAPQSTLTITGGGDVTINGSVWVGDFDNNSTGTVTISPDLITREPTASDPSTSGRAYKFYSTTDSRTPRPITGSPTNWKTEQIN